MKVKSLVLKRKNYLVTFHEIDQEFTVSQDLVLEYRLLEGKILDQTTFKSFKASLNLDKYRQKLMYYATYKPRTIKEARLYLDKFDMDNSSKEKYINQLIKSKILNDEVYTKNFIEEYSIFRLIGPIKIRLELSKKGISSSLINRYISTYKKELMIENIDKLIIKKLRSIKNKPLKKVIISLKTFVTNKGYDYSDVQNEVHKLKDKIVSSVNEDDILKKEYDKYLQKYKRSDKSKTLKNYLVPKLLQKGFSYPKILNLLEGEE